MWKVFQNTLWNTSYKIYLKYKIQKYINVFCISQNTLQNTKRRNIQIFSNNMVQTLARLMFNKVRKQYCFDVLVLTASRMIRLTVHFDEESLFVLWHWTAAQHLQHFD